VETDLATKLALGPFLLRPRLRPNPRVVLSCPARQRGPGRRSRQAPPRGCPAPSPGGPSNVAALGPSAARRTQPTPRPSPSGEVPRATRHAAPSAQGLDPWSSEPASSTGAAKHSGWHRSDHSPIGPREPHRELSQDAGRDCEGGCATAPSSVWAILRRRNIDPSPMRAGPPAGLSSFEPRRHRSRSAPASPSTLCCFAGSTCCPSSSSTPDGPTQRGSPPTRLNLGWSNRPAT
jgi:hypothetical protein